MSTANIYKKAAEQGDAEAQFNLGLSYYYGRGCKKNRIEATRWFAAAVKNGHKGAKKFLDEEKNGDVFV